MGITATAIEVKTLSDLLAYRNRETPDRIGLHFGGESYTYAHLYSEATRFARLLFDRGIAREDRVVMLVPNSPEFFYCFYGTVMSGAVAVPLFPGTAPERNLRIAGLSGASCLVLPDTLPEARKQEFRDQAEGMKLDIFCVGDAVGLEPLEKLPPVAPRDLAFLQFTSGSTGDPKGVMLTHGCLVTNVTQMVKGMEITGDDVFVSWLPTYHDMGLILMTIAPFYMGSELALLPTSLSNVRVWLKAIQDHGGTFTAAPDFAYRLCLRYIRRPDEFDISSLRVALNAAEPVRAGTIIGFEEAFGLQNVLQGGYGLAECTVGVSMSAPGMPIRVDKRGLVSVGQPFPDVTVKILDNEGKPVPSGVIGRIAVSSPANCMGYFKNEDAGKALFTDDDFLDTGDMGYLDDRGELYIAGRLKNVIITGGKTIANQEIEETVDQHPSVRASAAVGIDRGHIEGEQAFVFAEIRRGPSLPVETLEEIAMDIVQSIHDKLGFRPGRVYLVKNHTIPKTYNGKVQHVKLRQSYIDNSLRQEGRILFPEF